jgi:hypothetical protein
MCVDFENAKLNVLLFVQTHKLRRGVFDEIFGKPKGRHYIKLGNHGLGEVYELKVFKNRVLRETYEPKRESYKRLKKIT